MTVAAAPPSVHSPAPGPRSPTPVRGRLLAGPFALLCSSALAFYMCIMMFLAALPVYAAERLQMTQAQIGLIIAAFALLAMLCKPHAGWALDVLGRRPVLLAGAAIFVLASLLYTVAAGVATLLIVRAFHGVGMGLYPTAGAAVVADLAPPQRRGEGMGYFSATGSFAMAVGPVLGMALASSFSFPFMCFVAAAFALASLVCAWYLPETGTRVAAPPPPLTVDGLFSRRAMLPSAVLLCLFLGYGGMGLST